MRRKKILLQTDYSAAKTGFGKFAKVLLEYLWSTGKYDLVHYVVGLSHSHPDLQRTPWKSVGCLPDDPEEMAMLNKDENTARLANYGAHLLDKVIYEEKPDIYIAAQDIWGVDFAIGRKWFDKITSIIWTTLDSIPILPAAVEAAKKTKNYWIWSDFATKDLNEKGYDQVKTVHGPLDCDNFKRLPEHKRRELRQAHNIPLDAYVTGFVFRNQLRKSVPNLLDGYKKFKRDNPRAKTRLLLHTHFDDPGGWRIPELLDEHKIDTSEILTTYICGGCLNYAVQKFDGQNIACPHCGIPNGRVTTQPGIGVNENQLNEVYNLMDVYCHPFTSGGQEIPIQEAKLTELITLVTEYSCGEEMCYEEANSMALNYAEYREPGTQFIKATTDPNSIAKQLTKVFKMKPDKKKKMEQAARQWVVDNFSIKKIGGELEEFFDNLPEVEMDWEHTEEELRDPNYQIPEQPDDQLWLKDIYLNILRMDVQDDDKGLKDWMEHIKRGMPRQEIENTFRGIAQKENSTIQKHDFSELLDDDDEGKRACMVIPQSIGDIFIVTSLFESFKEQYPDYNLYVATLPQHFDMLQGNPHIHKIIPYIDKLDDLLWTEGRGNHKGYFDITFLPTIGTQKMFDYQHNGKDKIAFDLT